MWNQGKELAEKFLNERIYSNTKYFHDPIPRNKPTLFSQAHKSASKKNAASEVVKANINILGKLLSLSAKFEEAIDFREALTYPLYTVPLSLAFPDGTKRQTQKSKLLEILLVNSIISTTEKEAQNLAIDMTAQFRSITTNLPHTFEDLIIRFLKSVPKGHQRIGIVADYYRDYSIKFAEREKRGSST